MNYFELFNLPVGFFVDQSELKRKFYALSRQFHPDFYIQASAEDQAEVLQKSALVNKGYKALSSPDGTLQYLLELKGLVVTDEKYNLEPGFLGEMMDINEELMDLEMEPEMTGLDKIEATTKNLLKEKYNDVEGIMAGYQEGVAAEETLLPVKEYYYQKKYLQRILDKIGMLRNIAPRS